MINGRK